MSMNTTNNSLISGSAQHGHRCHCASPTITGAREVFTLIEKYVGPPLLAFGIVCNVLALLTLRQPKLKESPFIHLKGLTLADLLALLLICIHLQAVDGDQYWTIYITYIFYPCINIIASFCIWIMVVMTLERCIFMQFPLWAPIWCTNSSAKFKIILVCLASFAVNCPRFLWYQVKSFNVAQNSSSNGTFFQTRKQRYTIGNKLNGTHFSIVLSWMYSAVHHFIPVFLLLSLNIFLIYKIHVQQKRHNLLRIHNRFEPVRTQEQTRLTITLIAITFMYSAMLLPSAFADPNIVGLIFHTNLRDIDLFQRVSNFLVWINLSFNFVMYTFINVKFMRAFKRMWGRWFLSLKTCGGLRTIMNPRVQPKKQADKGFIEAGRRKTFPLIQYPAPTSVSS